MSSHVFKKLIYPEEARRILLERFRPVDEVEKVKLVDAVYRVLAEDIVAGVDLPPYTRSLRDGYAVRSVDVAEARENNPIRLRVKDVVEAGDIPREAVEEGEAVYVATGAPIPPGADAVVMEEYTEREDGYVKISHYSAPGEWIQNAGSDVSMGETVFEKGVFLGPREIGILSGLGYTEVPVYRRLRARVISSGDEVVEPGHELRPGQIYDVNGHAITSALSVDGCEASFIGIAEDTKESMSDLLHKALGTGDVVVFSGATSVGVKDLLRDVISAMEDARFLFDGVRIKPGKPTMAAEIQGRLFIGLPGFPVSSLMVYLHIFSPVIRRLNHLPVETEAIETRAGASFDSVFGVVHLHPVYIKETGSGYISYPIHTDSGAIATLRLADGYVIIPDNQNYLEVGDKAKVRLFPGSKAAQVISFSSHSIAYDRLLHMITGRTGIRIKKVYVGSSASLKYTSEGFSDMGVIHLLSREGIYNEPFVREAGGVALYHGFYREIGLVVARGNPHGVKDFRDVLSKRLRFINRVRGSGIRVYIDLMLEEIASREGLNIEELRRRIFGYNVEARTHSAVVMAVEKGFYDVGVASRLSTVGRDVDFIPLTWERVDYIFNLESLKQDSLKTIVEQLSSKDAVNLLRSLPGIRVDGNYFKRLI